LYPAHASFLISVFCTDYLLLRQWIENLGTTYSSPPGEKAGGSPRAEQFVLHN
jgi:hypothetical protein